MPPLLFWKESHLVRVRVRVGVGVRVRVRVARGGRRATSTRGGTA